MFTREKIYTVYEKPEASDPADRMVLLREGFLFWACVFNAVWLIFNRRWLSLAIYLGLAVVLGVLIGMLQPPQLVVDTLPLLLQVVLGFHANDLQGWVLSRRGYRLAGVLVAESEMGAERRYHEFAA